MIRRMVVAAVMALSLSACSEPVRPLPAATFTGHWRSVTANYEHLRLTVTQNAALNDGLHVRLTFSGVAWEGPGRIEADSLVMDITTAAISGAKVIAHPAADSALRVHVESSAASPLTLTFVRDQ
jgi:hypothetical protein